MSPASVFHRDVLVAIQWTGQFRLCINVVRLSHNDVSTPLTYFTASSTLTVACSRVVSVLSRLIISSTGASSSSTIGPRCWRRFLEASLRTTESSSSSTKHSTSGTSLFLSGILPVLVRTQSLCHTLSLP